MTDNKEQDIDKPSKKKVLYPISQNLREYLRNNDRECNVNIKYSDLIRFSLSTPLTNLSGTDTFWEIVHYQEAEREELYEGLKYVYARLKTDGDVSIIDHLAINRVDFCTFGNSKPFRIRVTNLINDNHDYFYVKPADASRVYGLELENILSPNWVNYFTNDNTIFEEHVAGIPGDIFIKENLNTNRFNQIRICKEYIKFNERCFLRLLGDMRSYNYVVDITPDIEGNQYRFRAIDFDQQCYEGRKNLYLPHFFRENNPINFVGFKLMTPVTVKQYREEERSLVLHRKKTEQRKYNALMETMETDALSSKEKIDNLKTELANHHQNPIFRDCSTMGQIVHHHIEQSLQSIR